MLIKRKEDKMNKIIITIAFVGAGALTIIDKINTHKKLLKIEERTRNIGNCHNDFYLIQERFNRSIGEQIEAIQEEIGSVYEHLEEISKDEKIGR